MLGTGRLLTIFHSCFACHLSSLFSCCFVSNRHSVPYSRSGSTNVRNALTLDRSLSVPDFHVLRLSRVGACDAACTLAFTSFCEPAFTSIFVPRYLSLLQATTIISSLLTLAFISNVSKHSITLVAHTSTSSSYTGNDSMSSTNVTSETSSHSSSSSDSL